MMRDLFCVFAQVNRAFIDFYGKMEINWIYKRKEEAAWR